MKQNQLFLSLSVFVLVTVLSQSVGAQTTVGMLAYFKFGGNLTNSGPANVTVASVGTSYTTNNAAAPNSAVQFAGNTGSYLDFTDNGNLDFTGSDNFTVSFSFLFTGASTGGLIDNCLNYNGWGVWIWSTVPGTWNLQFNYKGTSIGGASTTAFTVADWHHAAIVRDNGTMYIYIDGVQRVSGPEGSATPSYPINPIAGAMAFSGFSPPRYNPLAGKMDEIRIYNRALTALEIAQLAPFALPLELGDFNASKTAAGIQLEWQTLSEQHTSHFDVLRSTDGINFSLIGTVAAVGQSNTPRLYHFTDYPGLDKTVFYRLKMVDADNRFVFSRVVAVKSSMDGGLQLFPNPAKDVLQIQVPATARETVQLSIIDASGKICLQRQVELKEGTNAISQPVGLLSPGTFYLSIKQQNGVLTKPFVKTN